MGRFQNLVATGIDGLAASPMRLFVCVGGVSSVLFLVTAGLAISEGLRAKASASLQDSPDLYVAADVFGADGPLPLNVVASIRSLPGVVAVVPRIVGRIQVGTRWVVVVGVEKESWSKRHQGEPKLNVQPGRVLVGAALARETGWRAGKKILLEAQTSLVMEVESTFEDGEGLGSGFALVMMLEDASELFERQSEVSDALVYCRPGYEKELASIITRDRQLRVQTRELVATYIDQAYTVRSGAMMMVFALGVALAFPIFVWLSDLGASQRRREIGILRACGWSVSDVLIVTLVENWTMALLSGGTAVVLAWIWIRFLGAPLIGSFFLPGSDVIQVDVPAVFGTLPILASFVLATVITSAAGILSVWRSTVVAPAQAIREG